MTFCLSKAVNVMKSRCNIRTETEKYRAQMFVMVLMIYEVSSSVKSMIKVFKIGIRLI